MHNVGIDCENGNVFCHPCNDFVYDPTLEAIQRSKRIILGKRKRDAEAVPTLNGTVSPSSESSAASTTTVPPKTCKSSPTSNELT